MGKQEFFGGFNPESIREKTESKDIRAEKRRKFFENAVALAAITVAEKRTKNIKNQGQLKEFADVMKKAKADVEEFLEANEDLKESLYDPYDEKAEGPAQALAKVYEDWESRDKKAA
jgi:hypothetical protein